MRVVCFYTDGVQANCLAALNKYAPDAEYVNTSADDNAYAREIAKFWDGTEDLVTVEHDNEITAEVLSSFAACDRLWCSFEYEIFAPPYTRMCDTGFGCTKFSKELQRKFSFREEILDSVCEYCGDTHAHWGMLDMRLCSQLSNQLQLGVHVHGQVPHYHPYQAVIPDENGHYPAPGGVVEFEGGFKRVGG